MDANRQNLIGNERNEFIAQQMRIKLKLPENKDIGDDENFQDYHRNNMSAVTERSAHMNYAYHRHRDITAINSGPYAGVQTDNNGNLTFFSPSNSNNPPSGANNNNPKEQTFRR